MAVAQKKKGDSSESDSDDDSDEEVPPKSKAPAATIKKEDSSEVSQRVILRLRFWSKQKFCFNRILDATRSSPS